MSSIKLIDFIKDIIDCDSIDSIIDKYDEQSMKGFVYERLWDLVIKFGFCDKFRCEKLNKTV